ncbi:WASH complex subunit 1 [Musca vetustissima]|uniref:WASH complex subunit 1 n=1 Tax=Musca vetustissima TaxID=27455 RepID=UPI002AB7AB2B|nr:WASH complex subunit 1 [Musca vetustissima]
MFSVPIVPPDLRHEETIIQAAYALDSLQKVINNIFLRIDNRLEKNNTKVEELQNRIKKSQEKIKNLQNTRKAIHIYAPARFPATHIFEKIPVTFTKEPNDNNFDEQHTSSYEVKSKIDSSLPNTNEKLVFFHVRENPKNVPDNSLTRERLKIRQTQDLGTMPNELKSVSSVLLFNSDYSPYNLTEGDADESDNWKRARLFKNKRNQKAANSSAQGTTAKQIPDPAPHSLAHRNEKLTPSGGLKYTPKLSEAPELDLPWDLPDLPGIADDLRYESQEAKQKIAPSLEMVVETLPDLDDLIKDSSKDKADENSTKKALSHGPAQETISQTATPPPPPPPPPPIAANSNTPPPPPPPSASAAPAQLPKLPASSDTRSELMAAIRKAGGLGKAPLKRAAAPLSNNQNNNNFVDNQNSAENNENRKTNIKPLGGDLMADLHNKLMMRRKGISGTKDNTTDNAAASSSISGNPVISRLSSLIPPPPVGRTKNASEEDDDSNDTDWVD